MPDKPRKSFAYQLQAGLLALGVAFLLINLVFFARLRDCPLLADHVPFNKSRVWSICPLCADREKVTISAEVAWRVRLFKDTHFQSGQLSK